MDPSILLQPGVLAGPLGRILVVLIGIAIVVLVGRFVLSIAWRLVTIGAVLVGVLLVLSTFGLLPF
jgi:hypothetical protein